MKKRQMEKLKHKPELRKVRHLDLGHASQDLHQVEAFVRLEPTGEEERGKMEGEGLTERRKTCRCKGERSAPEDVCLDGGGGVPPAGLQLQTLQPPKHAGSQSGWSPTKILPFQG